MGLFQKRLQLVLQPHVIARQLVLPARHRPPQTLLGIGHKAESQFSGHQSLDQTFGIGKIPLASPPPAIGLRLRQMQRSRLSALRLPASRGAASSTVPALPKLVSNIGPSIP